MRQPVFTDFAPHHADLFGRHTLELGHRFDEADGLFGDGALADLIERTPRKAYHVNTMDVTTHDPRTRREGTLQGVRGAAALDAVRSGHIAVTATSCAPFMPSSKCGCPASSHSITRCRS